jgi:hypothetical protein
MAELRRLNCPYIEGLFYEDEQPAKELHPDGYCHFCGKRLAGSEFPKCWAEHDIPGMGLIQTCLDHQGVREWHHQERKKEREHDRSEHAEQAV